MERKKRKKEPYDANQSCPVKSVPTPFDKIKAVNTLGKLLLRECSIDDLSLEDHLIWLSLQSLILGDGFNQSMHNVTLPSGLQSLTFGVAFNQSMDNVALPNGLQSLTFGDDFNQSMPQCGFAQQFAELDIW